MKRTPLNRYTRLAPGKPLRRKKWMKRISDKRRAELPLRRAAMDSVRRRSRGTCEARTPACTVHARDGHEPLPRSGGGNPNDADQVLDCCRACHRWITRNPAAARRLGLSKSRYAIATYDSVQEMKGVSAP